MTDNNHNCNNNITAIPLITQVQESGSKEDVATFTSSIIVKEDTHKTVELVEE